MIRPRADSGEWCAYYERAERARALMGDPLLHYRARVVARERYLFVASAFVMAMTLMAFVLLTLG
jgi:hypothetical protein